MFDIREGSGASIMLSVQTFGILAAAPRDPNQWVGPGLLGFLVIVLLGVATFLLWRNMNKQLRRVRFKESPDRSGSGSGAEGSGGVDGGGVDGGGVDGGGVDGGGTDNDGATNRDH